MSRTFADIIGNARIKEHLTRMVEGGNVANTLLFAGPAGVGKGLFAEALAATLLCHDDADGVHRRKVDHGNHPDLRVYRTEGKTGMHSIGVMRQLGKDAQQTPYEAERKAFVVHDAERMLPTAANALLKTFEEPAATSVIILVSGDARRLLPTILSRCQQVNFQPVEEEGLAALLQQHHGKSEEEAEPLARQARGSVARAVALAGGAVDAKRELLLKLLACGRLQGYHQLSDAVKRLNETVEEAKQQTEEALTSQSATDTASEMTAVQKEALAKEIEGAVTMQFRQEVDDLLDIVVSWYRDLHLLHVNGDRRHLINVDRYDALEQALQRGLMLPMEDVHQAAADVRLAVARSIPLSASLESLFLSLDVL